MADLLILDNEIWMNSMTQNDIELYNIIYPGFQKKYDSRDRKGDVIEERPDGFWSAAKGRNFDKAAFCVINVPDKELKHPGRMAIPLFEISLDPDIQLKILINRKYNIDVSGLVFTGKIATSNYDDLNITVKEELKHG